MMAEIRRRNRTLGRLQRRRRALMNQLKKIDTEISRLGGNTAAIRGLAEGRKRFKNKITLADAIAKVLNKEKPIRVSEIMAGVERIGYRSASKTFRTIIFQTLAKDKRVKQAGRGLYMLKG
jgi:septal ring factor EnvC (AmiA/AmiB activator)